MHLQVLLDELTQRHRPRSTRAEPIERSAERRLRLHATREATHLRPLRAAPFEPIAVRPQRLAIRPLRLQLEHLALLDHRYLLDRSGIEESERLQ